jgi:hypothetical protein
MNYPVFCQVFSKIFLEHMPPARIRILLNRKRAQNAANCLKWLKNEPQPFLTQLTPQNGPFAYCPITSSASKLKDHLCLFGSINKDNC